MFLTAVFLTAVFLTAVLLRVFSTSACTDVCVCINIEALLCYSCVAQIFVVALDTM